MRGAALGVVAFLLLAGSMLSFTATRQREWTRSGRRDAAACMALYRRARTVSDSLAIDVTRLTWRGGRTCYALTHREQEAQ